MLKVRSLVHDDDLVSCVITDNSGCGRCFAVLFQMADLSPASEIPEGCAGLVKKALPAIRQALAEHRIPGVSEGRSATLQVA